MLSRRVSVLLLLLLVAGAFAWGVLHLFRLRFAAGDVYPHYSSLRADPLGARVYFESLEAAGGRRVERFLDPPDQLPHGRDRTLLVLGLPWHELTASENEYKALEGFVRGGGRLVVMLHPEPGRPRNFVAGSNAAPVTPGPGGRSGDEAPRIALAQRWGFVLAYVPAGRDARTPAAMPVQRVGPGSLPESLTWHSTLVLTNLDLAWRVHYARGTEPVLAERAQGQGTIVLATDSYLVSNEALRRERAVELLAWLPGAGRDTLFSETHLGVQRSPGVATLARHYGLHGGVAALLVLAALFLWRSASSFVPRTSEPADGAVVSGRESAAGFENLLRRGVPAGQLLQTALNEWHKSRALDRRATPRRRDEVRAVVESFNADPKADPVATYRRIAAILNRRA